MPDLDRTWIERGLLKQRLGNAVGVGLLDRSEVDRLDQRVRPLTGQRLREPGDRSAEDAERAGFVVTMPSAETRPADEERRLRQRAHRRREQLDADMQRIAPSRGRELRHRPFEIESRQPEHTVDRAGLDPLAKLGLKCGDARRALEGENVRAGVGQLRAQHVGDAALVRHDDDPAPRTDRDSGRETQLERWPRYRHRHAAGEALGVGGAQRSGLGRRRGLDRGGRGGSARRPGQARARRPGPARPRRWAQGRPRRRAQARPPRAPADGRGRTRRRDSASGSPAASTRRHARSRTTPGSTRTPPPA